MLETFEVMPAGGKQDACQILMRSFWAACPTSQQNQGLQFVWTVGQ